MRIADPNALVDSARRIFIMKQFNNAASHLLVSTLTPGVESIEALSSYNLQKLLLRELRLWKAAPEEGKLVWNTMKARWHPGLYAAKGKQKASSAAATSQDEDDDASDSDGDGRAASRSAAASQPRSTMNMDPIKRPTKPSPVLFTYYGALMMVAKSYQSAMCACTSLPSLLSALRSSIKPSLPIPLTSRAISTQITSRTPTLSTPGIRSFASILHCATSAGLFSASATTAITALPR